MRLGDHSDYAEPSSADRFLRESCPLLSSPLFSSPALPCPVLSCPALSFPPPSLLPSPQELVGQAVSVGARGSGAAAGDQGCAREQDSLLQTSASASRRGHDLRRLR
eukprot:547421-Hanusia_phi.AAC.1